MTDEQRARAILAGLLAAERKAVAALVAVTVGAGPALVAAMAGRESKTMAYLAGMRVTTSTEAAAESAMLAARVQARMLAREKTLAELAHLGFVTGDPGVVTATAYDRLRASRAATSIGGAVRGSIVRGAQTWDQSGQPKGGLTKAMRGVSSDIAPRAKLNAVTESAQAFNRERLTMIQERAGDRADEFLLRLNAELDKQTCSECESLDGQTWPIADAPDPPPFHPRCRCSLELIRR